MCADSIPSQSGRQRSPCPAQPGSLRQGRIIAGDSGMVLLEKSTMSRCWLGRSALANGASAPSLAIEANTPRSAKILLVAIELVHALTIKARAADVEPLPDDDRNGSYE